MKVAGKRYYTNADKSKLVDEDSKEAAYLVVAEGQAITPEMAEKYGIEGVEPVAEPAKAEVAPDAAPDGETDAGTEAADKQEKAEKKPKKGK